MKVSKKKRRKKKYVYIWYICVCVLKYSCRSCTHSKVVGYGIEIPNCQSETLYLCLDQKTILEFSITFQKNISLNDQKS